MQNAIRTVAKDPIDVSNFPLVKGQEFQTDRGHISVVRTDGLRVWFDRGDTHEERVVNTLRLTAPAEVVQAAVALLRGRQVFMGYARIREDRQPEHHFGMFFSGALDALDPVGLLHKAVMPPMKQIKRRKK